MLVVVMKFRGAMDMEFIMTCELMPNSTGDVCNGPPYEAVKSALIVMAPCAYVSWVKPPSVLMFIQVASMGFMGCIAAGKPRPMFWWRGVMLVELAWELCVLEALESVMRR